jgi:hypothetical protein
MKRTAVVLAIALASAGLAFAQPVGPGMGGGPGRGNNPNAQQQQQEAPKTVTIEGKLVFIDSYPAVQTKDKTYILRMPRFYYYAYTDGIKEGAQVKAEGVVLPTFPGQDKPFFAVTKATIGAKTYDLSELAQQRGFCVGGMGMGPGGMGGPGGRW